MVFIRPVQKSTRETVLRVTADVILLQLSLLAAFAIRFVHYGFTRGNFGESPPALLDYYAHNYLYNAPIITMLNLSVFAISGFYSFGRAYSGRYKFLVVAQAVSASFLIYGAFAFALRTELTLTFPVWILDWSVSLIAIASARLWSRLWFKIQEEQASSRLSIDNRLVVVIGGAGYIGSALIPMLLDKGYRVRILDLFLYGREPLGDLPSNPRLEMLEADFRNVDSVVRACQGAGAVVHLGGLVGDPACAVDESLTIDINLMATRMIAEVAKGCEVRRFIFASTCSVYGASDLLLDEHSALNPVSLYARSKIASEKVVLGLADSHFAPTILRFATIYGLSGRTRFDLVLNLLTAKAAVEKLITLQGGDQWRPFLHVEDAALSVLSALEAEPEVVREQIFNVGTDEHNYTLEQVATMIQKQVPEAAIVEQGLSSDRRNYRVNFSKIYQRLRYKARWSPEAGIAQVLLAIREGKVLNYKDPRFSNVMFLLEDGNVRLPRSDQTWAEDLIRESGPDTGRPEAKV